MNRILPPRLLTLTIGMAIFGSLLFPSSAFAAGGACPSGANYITATDSPLNLVSLSSLGIKSCYYISNSGSDANSGTSETSPWLHAPGMGACSGACASVTPSAGVGFILRGGDTWHASSGAPTICASGPCQWTWSWVGSSSNPIYIGADANWYSGSSWVRPILNMDNPVTTAIPSTCAYDDSSISGLKLTNPNGTSSGSYIIVDNLEFTGKCWSSSSISSNSVAYLYRTGTNIAVERSYFHGWSMTPTGFDAHASISGYGGVGADNNVIASVVIDGSDSTHSTSSTVCAHAANGAPCNTGWGIQGDCYDIHDTIVRYTSNTVECTNVTIVHDSLFEYNYASITDLIYGGPHPNTIEGLGYRGQNFLMYNNILRHNLQNVNVWVEADTQWIFNNVFYDTSTAAANCIMIQLPAGDTVQGKLYFYNNTVDVGLGHGCQIQYMNTNPIWSGTSNFANNHFIASGGSLNNINICDGGASCTINDLGGEIYQTEAVANSQGYVQSNDYAPTSSTGNATVGGGVSQAGSCATFSSDMALCSGTSGAAVNAPGEGGYWALFPGIAINPRPDSGAWNAGAYQFAANSINPPTGLAAVVQ